MANTEELGNQVSLAQQLKKLISDMGSSHKTIEASLSRQTRLSKNLAKHMTIANRSGLGKMGSQVEELNEGLEEASSRAEEFKDSLEDAADAADEASSSGGGISSLLGSFGKFAGIGAIVGGVGLAFSKLLDVVSFVGGAIKSVLQAVGSVVYSALMAPFRLLQGLIELAGSGGGLDPVWQQLEEIRESLGMIYRGTFSKVVTNMNKSLSDSAKSIKAIFGWGRAGKAEALKYLYSLASKNTYALEKLRGEIVKLPGDLIRLGKALNITEDEFSGLMNKATTTGNTLTSQLTRVASNAKLLERSMGDSFKLIAKNLLTMEKDFEHFGHLSQAELNATAVFAKRTGISIEELGGIADKFLNFDDAAESVGKLTSAFGVQIDTMKLINAASPAEQIDQIRQAFNNAGLSIDNMSMAQKKLLGEATGLKGMALQTAFSTSTMGESYDSLMAGGEAAAETQMSTAEAIKALNVEIRNMRKGGGGGIKSFFDAFVKGFTKGLMRGKEFRQMMMNIRRALRETKLMGMRFGDFFLKTFPGVKKFFGSIEEFFEPNKFRKGILDPIEGVLESITTAIAIKSPKDFRKALEKAFESVKDFFMGKSGEVEGFGEGIWEFYKGIGFALRETGLFLLENAIKGITMAFDAIADYLDDPSKYNRKFKNAIGMDAVMDDFKEGWSGVVVGFDRVLLQNWPKVEKAFKKLFDKISLSIRRWWEKGGERSFEELGAEVEAHVGEIVEVAIKGALVYAAGSAGLQLGMMALQSAVTSKMMGVLGTGGLTAAGASGGALATGGAAAVLGPAAILLGAAIAGWVLYGYLEDMNADAYRDAFEKTAKSMGDQTNESLNKASELVDTHESTRTALDRINALIQGTNDEEFRKLLEQKRDSIITQVNAANDAIATASATYIADPTVQVRETLAKALDESEGNIGKFGKKMNAAWDVLWNQRKSAKGPVKAAITAQMKEMKEQLKAAGFARTDAAGLNLLAFGDDVIGDVVSKWTTEGKFGGFKKHILETSAAFASHADYALQHESQPQQEIIANAYANFVASAIDEVSGRDMAHAMKAGGGAGQTPIWMAALEAGLFSAEGYDGSMPSAQVAEEWTHRQVEMVETLMHDTAPKIRSVIKQLNKAVGITDVYDVLTATRPGGQKKRVVVSSDKVQQTFNIQLKLGVKSMIAALTGKPESDVSHTTRLATQDEV